MHDLRPMSLDFGFFELGIGTNNNEISRRDEMGCGPIDADRSASGRSSNGVSDQPIPIVDIIDVDLLVLGDICGKHEVIVDRDASLVMQLSIRHCRTMDFGFEQNSLHKVSDQISMD